MTAMPPAATAMPMMSAAIQERSSKRLIWNERTAHTMPQSVRMIPSATEKNPATALGNANAMIAMTT